MAAHSLPPPRKADPWSDRLLLEALLSDYY